MFKSRKTLLEVGLPLSLRITELDLHRTFDAKLANNVRHMTTELLCNGELPRRIAFLAAQRGEGVTHTALAFATTLANDTGRRVCVVELNWWNPGVLSVLHPHIGDDKKRRTPASVAPLPTELTDRPGLAQVITNEVDLDQAIIATELPNLSILPAGNMPMIQRPMLARSDSLRSTVEMLNQRFDHLVLDTPAVLLTSDAIALASLSDACCVVVRHGITPTSSVQSALDDVRHLPMLGVIYNQVSIDTPQWIQSLIGQG